MELKLNAVFILLILSLTLVSCAPPFIQSNTLPGLTIETSYADAHKLGDSLYIHAHVYNATNGLLKTTGTNCDYHVYNHNLEGDQHIDKGILSLYGMGFYNNTNGTLFNETGEYSVLIWCNSSDVGGFFRYTFEVTPTGTLLEVSDSVLYLVFLAILFIIMLGLFKILFSSENKYLRYGLVAIIYILSNVFLLILWKVSEYFLYLVPFIQTLFNALYVISTIGYFILFPVLIFSMIMSIFDDKEVLKLQESGYSDEDISRVRRRR